MDKHNPGAEPNNNSARLQRSALAAGTLILPGWADALGAEERPKAKVVVVTTKAVISADQPAPQALIDSKVERGVTTLTGKSDPIQAWTTFVRPTDSVCLPTAGGQLENIPEVIRTHSSARAQESLLGANRRSRNVLPD